MCLRAGACATSCADRGFGGAACYRRRRIGCSKTDARLPRLLSRPRSGPGLRTLMASLNRVDLIGVVATRVHRTGDGDEPGFVLLTRRAFGDGVERLRVLTDGRTRLQLFDVGDSVYIGGHVEGARSRIVVVAREGFCIQPAAPADALPGPGTASHRSPIAHERGGHLRHVGAGTPRERLVWVRPTTVHGRTPVAGSV